MDNLMMIGAGIGVIWGLGFMLIVAGLFINAVRSDRGLNIGHILAALIWPIWLGYYLWEKYKGRA